MAMRFGSLFAGIGGMDLGLERAGMQCIWRVEIDDYCGCVLEKHWPDIHRYGDVKDVGKHNLETPDLICGGFPCQPVSLAGKRKAQADPRWLWPEFARVVDELRPRYVLVENVPGLYIAGGSEVLADLASLGYDAEWDAIPAAAVGAPHLRYRIFIVAYASWLVEQSRTGDTVCNTTISGLSNRTKEQMGKSRTHEKPERSDWWSVEPNVGRVAHGVPSRVDRLRGLGNAVVPQVAEWIGRRIMEYNDGGYA